MKSNNFTTPKSSFSRNLKALLLPALLLTTTPMFAENDDDEIEDKIEQMEAQMKEMQELIAQLQTTETETQTEIKADKEKGKNLPQIHGNIRGKFEYQPEIDEGRFQVRNARLNVTGNLANDKIYYKAEIDLSDQGTIRMLDAYVKLLPAERWGVAIGQMRVPFTIDAHRSPYNRFFANRSFIGKQVGDIRDVGAVVSYSNKKAAVPYILEAGIFNGDGLTDQKSWQTDYNYSAKAQFFFGDNWNLTISDQSICPNTFRVNMVDVGTYYKTDRLHLEAEYLYKTYEDGVFDDVHSFDTFASYSFPLKKGIFKNLAVLGRYDVMSDHSDGYMSDDEIAGGYLALDDSQRHRITGGVTLSLDKMFVAADLRLNYEKYFYKTGAVIDSSEMDKIVIELVCKF